MELEMSSPKGKRAWVFRLVLGSQVTAADSSGQAVLKDSRTKCTRNG